jgi:hypothetical protein
MLDNIELLHLNFLLFPYTRTTLSSRHSFASIGVEHAPATATTEVFSEKYSIYMKLKVPSSQGRRSQSGPRGAAVARGGRKSRALATTMRPSATSQNSCGSGGQRRATTRNVAQGPSRRPRGDSAFAAARAAGRRAATGTRRWPR